MSDLKKNKKHMQEGFELPRETMAKNEKRRKQNAFVVLAVIFAVFILAIAAALYVVFYMPNFKQIPPDEYFGVSELPAVVIGGERAGAGGAVYYNGETYVAVSFINEHLRGYFFYEKITPENETAVVTVTTADTLYRIYEGDDEYSVNYSSVKLSRAAFVRDGDMYLPAAFISAVSPYTFSYYTDTHTVIVSSADISYTTGVIPRAGTNMRYEPDIKSPIEKKLPENAEVTVFEEANERFTKIRTADGLIGYTETSGIRITGTTGAADPPAEPAPLLLDEPVIMLWDQITTRSGNTSENRQTIREGVNVLSPTWFSFDTDNLDGTITDIGDIEYVNRARANGVRVWALITDNFQSAVGDAVLTNPHTRDYIISQLLGFADSYGLDGINIDFEMVSTYAAPFFVQFLRELAVFTRERGLVLSVDMFVPTYTMYYNRTEIIKAADYICVMAYDEHYGAASGSGPVASLPFVEDGIVKTLREVPADRLVLGLPFYTRIWREARQHDGTIAVSVERNMFMDAAERIFIENGAGAAVWQPEAGYYYNEYTTGENGVNTVFKAWFEDETSIREKMKLYEKYELAGIAGWSRGMESDGAWEAILESVRK